MEDPYLRRRKLDKAYEAMMRWRAENPEDYREAIRRYRAAVKSDAERYAAQLEARRISYRLKREREGLPVMPSGSLPKNVRRVQVDTVKLPAAPLASALEGMIRGSRKEFCSGLGINERQLRAWSVGEIQSVQVGTAERVLRAAGLEWDDVFGVDSRA